MNFTKFYFKCNWNWILEVYWSKTSIERTQPHNYNIQTITKFVNYEWKSAKAVSTINQLSLSNSL